MDNLNKDFSEFYHNLKSNDQIIFVFFSSGLLFLLPKFLERLPSDTNLVLITADLNLEERKWLESRYRYPTFFVQEYINDNQVWDLLFSVCTKNFGWLDLDCFILNSTILKEITHLHPSNSFNTIWTIDSLYIQGIPIITSYFVFVNMELYKQINQTLRSPIFPSVYVYENDPPFSYSHYYSVTKEQQQWLDTIIPKGAHTYADFFDSLQCYQLIAQSMGYPIRRVRDLKDHVNGLDRYFSDDVIHMGNSCYFSPEWSKRHNANIQLKFDNDPNNLEQFWYLIIIYNIYSNALPELPKQYEKYFKYIKHLIFDRINVDWRHSGEILKDCFLRHNLNEETAFYFLY